MYTFQINQRIKYGFYTDLQDYRNNIVYASFHLENA